MTMTPIRLSESYMCESAREKDLFVRFEHFFDTFANYLDWNNKDSITIFYRELLTIIDATNLPTKLDMIDHLRIPFNNNYAQKDVVYNLLTINRRAELQYILTVSTGFYFDTKEWFLKHLKVNQEKVDPTPHANELDYYVRQARQTVFLL